MAKVKARKRFRVEPRKATGGYCPAHLTGFNRSNRHVWTHVVTEAGARYRRCKYCRTIRAEKAS